MQKRNLKGVRDHNRSLILRQLFRRPGLSRSDIADLIGLTDAAVSRITREMIAGGIVQEGGKIADEGRPGRRHVGLSLRPRGAVVLAACLTLFEKSLVTVDMAGEVIARADLSDVINLPPDTIPRTLEEAARDLSPERSRVLGLGIVVAGALDHERGLMRAGSISSLIGVPLRSILEERLEFPVRVENLGNALNVAEGTKGTAAGETALLVHVALGLGASLVIDGRPHRHDGDERLIGHIQVLGATSRCVCGATGCLDTLVSGRGLLEQANIVHEEPDDAARHLSEVIAAAQAGDPAWTMLFRAAGLALGRHLFAVSVAGVPDRVTLAGPVPQVTAYAEGVRDGLSQAFARAKAMSPRLGVSTIGYGRAAAIFALEEFLLNTPLDMKHTTMNPPGPVASRRQSNLNPRRKSYATDRS